VRGELAKLGDGGRAPSGEGGERVGGGRVGGEGGERVGGGRVGGEAGPSWSSD
jgi:hypothetical protein